MSVEITEADEIVEMERRFVESAWNRGDVSVIDETHSSELIVHWNAEATDREGLKEYIRTVRRAFPDFHMAIDFVHASEDMVTVGCSASGTHTRRFMGLPPTNKFIHVTGMWTHRIEDGEVVEGWTSMNEMDMLRQLGLVFPRDLITIPRLYLRQAIRAIRR
jgi:steroid delta-isomerase-like uncharacterized protein